MSNIILFDEEQNIIEIQYEGVNAQLLAELDVRLTDLEQQTATDYFLLNAELNALQATVNQLTVLVQQNYDDIQQEIEDRENADNDLSESFANEIILTQQLAADAIQLEAETRAAAIIAESEARGTAIATLETELNTEISAIATTVSGLAATVGGNTAAIILANEAIALETETRAAQYSAILADFGDTNAAVLEESVVRADADAAFASQLTIVEADIDGAYAAVSAEATARASADSAMATNITALGVQVGNNATAILTEASARVAADGSIESKYSVKIDVNGNVAGFGLISQANNGSVVSTFNFRSDTFNIWNGSSPVPPFSVSGGTVFLDNLVVRSIVRQGQTAYDTGTGFWLGNDGGTPRFSIGNSGANKLTWNGSNLNIVGTISMTNNSSSFAPSWSGFSSAPVGNLSYLDLGAIVFLWAPANRIGTSDSGTMSFTGLPVAIRPTSLRSVSCILFVGSSVVPGTCFINSSGLVEFNRTMADTTGGSPAPVYANYALPTSGSKGLPDGFLVTYPK